ncbi:MAG: single-strand DNA-binding protein [Crocinitomicaceae bacterium]|jgi:single-strand DNA-binding protein
MRNSSLTTANGASDDAGSIFFSKKEMCINHVNLIGKMTSLPRFYELPNGRKVVQFTLSTKETYLDEHGEVKNRSHWHRICAWGRWVKVIDELGSKGLRVAIEGKLTTRFYHRNGERQFISEVEVNDLIIL